MASAVDRPSHQRSSAGAHGHESGFAKYLPGPLTQWLEEPLLCLTPNYIARDVDRAVAAV